MCAIDDGASPRMALEAWRAAAAPEDAGRAPVDAVARWWVAHWEGEEGDVWASS
jgi:hypothetical protein